MNSSDKEKFLSMIRQLVSDVQGAPYPGPSFEPELYSIWDEHVQRNAQECFELVIDVERLLANMLDSFDY